MGRFFQAFDFRLAPGQGLPGLLEFGLEARDVIV